MSEPDKAVEKFNEQRLQGFDEGIKRKIAEMQKVDAVQNSGSFGHGYGCPNCGYCPHCGRGGHYYPNHPYPYWYGHTYITC